MYTYYVNYHRHTTNSHMCMQYVLVCPLLLRLMETANRDEALRCLGKAQTALREGRVEAAEKFASKSLRLCPTEEAKGKSCSIEKPFVYMMYSGTLTKVSDEQTPVLFPNLRITSVLDNIDILIKRIYFNIFFQQSSRTN